ncbi:MAG: hypothetical protein JXR96_11595 [Deltaproteobacteria bacterium]|nr:hypothetical protein [Deltaproteobacteria bacterium]
MKRSAPTLAWLGLVLLAAIGCRDERFFGPYSLTLPTDMLEQSAGRTFRLPLSDADLEELDDLADCIEQEPDRELPCICDYPVLSVDELELRIDYQARNLGSAVVNAHLWVGVEKEPGTADPDVLPDLPRIEVLSEHLHRLAPGERAAESFFHDEMREVDLSWSLDRHPDCDPEDTGILPAPTELTFGASLPEDELTELEVEMVFRVRGNG